jgi:hypothetical protein
MEGDDEPDRPLDEQDALLQGLLPTSFATMMFTASSQERFRTSETTYLRSGVSAVNLANEAWSHGSAEIVRRDRRVILAVLGRNRTALRSVSLGYHFLTSSGPTLPNEGDSSSHLRTTLYTIGNLVSLRFFKLVGLPSSPEAINIRILLEAMAKFRNDLESVELTHIEIRSNSEVQLLADLLGSRGGALTELYLEVLIPIINDDMAGLLDPILLAMKSPDGASYLLPSCFELSTGDGVWVSAVSLISEATLNRFLPCVTSSFNAGNKRELYLKGLGLGDSHVKLIAELMSNVNKGESVSLSLHLQSNPAIGLPGYEALLGMLNRRSDIEQIRVDDAGWTATYKMVVHMNTKHGRGEFMEGGVFPDRVAWIDWVIRLANVAPAEEVEEDEDEKQDFEARKLNYIWFTLVQKPDFVSN